MACCPDYKDHLQVLNGFLVKADGKDKLTALIQYACLFISAGEAGNIKKVQASVAAARKVFRVLKPLETITPLLVQPGFSGKQPKLLEAVNKVKALCNLAYFVGDHYGWAHQIGLVSDKAAADKWQKISLWGWALASLITVATEGWQIMELSVVRKDGESEADYNKRVEDARKAANARMLTLIHGAIQATLAGGMLNLVSMKPRTLGALGVAASALNCYFLMPSYPKAKAKTA